MTPPPRRRWSVVAQAATALALAAWRVQAPTWHPFWTDALFLVAVYWIFCLAFLHTRAWAPVTALLMAALGAIYLQGQMPHMLAVVDLLP